MNIMVSKGKTSINTFYGKINVQYPNYNIYNSEFITIFVYYLLHSTTEYFYLSCTEICSK